MLGVSTNRPEPELTLLYSVLPRIEAYHEYVNRRHQSRFSAQRAYDIVLAVTDDAEAADRAYNKIIFEETAYE